MSYKCHTSVGVRYSYQTPTRRLKGVSDTSVVTKIFMKAIYKLE